MLIGQLFSCFRTVYNNFQLTCSPGSCEESQLLRKHFGRILDARPESVSSMDNEVDRMFWPWIFRFLNEELGDWAHDQAEGLVFASGPDDRFQSEFFLLICFFFFLNFVLINFQRKSGISWFLGISRP